MPKSVTLETEMTTTSIYIPVETLTLLRLVATSRGMTNGGVKSSVSQVILDLVVENKERLKREIRRGNQREIAG